MATTTTTNMTTTKATIMTPTTVHPQQVTTITTPTGSETTPVSNVLELSANISFLKEDYKKSIQQANEKRARDTKKFEEVMEKQRRENSLAMEEFWAFVTSTFKSQGEVIDSLKEG